MSEPAKKHWLLRPKTIRLLWRGAFVVLALLVLGDFLVSGHPTFRIDGTFGFYAWFGFAICVALVLLAKGLGILIERKDIYYDD